MVDRETLDPQVRDWRESNLKETLWFGAGIIVAGVASLGIHHLTSQEPSFQQIADRFPNTSFDRIARVEGTDLYAAETGQTIVYVTSNGEYALVGNLLDLENKVDLTEARRRELSDFAGGLAALDGIAVEDKPAIGSAATPPQTAPERPVRPVSLDVDIPEGRYVVHNPGAGPIVWVVADYNCSFCQRLAGEFEGLPFEVREIPVGFLGAQSRLKAAAVLCDEDPSSLASAFYSGRGSSTITTCSTGEDGVDANTAWAQQNGITGTPFMVRDDGVAHSGYLPGDRLASFLGAS